MYRITKSDGYMAFHSDCLSSIQIDYSGDGRDNDYVIIRLDYLNVCGHIVLTMVDFRTLCSSINGLNYKINQKEKCFGHIGTYYDSLTPNTELKIFYQVNNFINFQICSTLNLVVSIRVTAKQLKLLNDLLQELIKYINLTKKLQKLEDLNNGPV